MSNPTDRLAVQELIDRYFLAVDRSRPDLMRSCFADHARYTSDAGLLDMNSGDEIGRRLAQGGRFAHTSHVRGSQQIEIDGDRAEADTFCVAYLVETQEAGAIVHVRGLQYRDRIERLNGEWKIVQRHHSTKWQFDQPACPFMQV